MRRPAIILASASPRRRELLADLEVPFKVYTAAVDELHTEALTASEQCQINAARKARAVARRHPDALVIGADTLVTLNNRHYGKPRDLRDAERMLLELQGRTHQVVTGVCLHHARARRERSFAELTEVEFKPLTAAQVQAYFARVDPLDKAGAYAIQEYGEWIVRETRGSVSNVIGLPLERLRVELDGWDALG